jgi:hypothetical protein
MENREIENGELRARPGVWAFDAGSNAPLVLPQRWHGGTQIAADGVLFIRAILFISGICGSLGTEAESYMPGLTVLNWREEKSTNERE